ncbi:MAG: hypothetical protein WAX77_12445 [Methylococcaceae bacterium]
MNTIPQNEIEYVIQTMRSHPEYFNLDSMINAYKSCGLEVIAEPFKEEVLIPIKYALQMQQPLSVIRIGDSEANLLTYGMYPETINLNYFVAKAAIARRKDSFTVDEHWLIILRDLLMGALAQADIIGVVGLWRPDETNNEIVIGRFLKDYRGVSGHWRAMDYMLTLANKKYFDTKIIASAHLYFSVLEHLDSLLILAKKIMIISNRKTIIENLQAKHPELCFDYIEIGINNADLNTLPDKPLFLNKVFLALPENMSGYLCLIGAGIWAEIYCTWVKQRGGVAIVPVIY